MAHIDANSLDALTQLDRTGVEARAKPDTSTGYTDKALTSALLVLIMLKAARDQDRNRRRHTATPAATPGHRLTPHDPASRTPTPTSS